MAYATRSTFVGVGYWFAGKRCGSQKGLPMVARTALGMRPRMLLMGVVLVGRIIVAGCGQSPWSSSIRSASAGGSAGPRRSVPARR